MTKRQPTATCPHCARVLRGRNASSHNCPEDPANRAAIMGALEDPARPGVARSAPQYAAGRVLQGPILYWREREVTA